MRSVIKSIEAQSLSSPHRHDRGAAAQISSGRETVDTPDARDSRIAQLEDQLARMDVEMKNLRLEAAEALAKGKAEGERNGREAAETLEKDRVELIATAAKAASEVFKQTMQGCEALAAIMAQSCLEKLFDDVDENAGRVKALLRRQLSGLERGAVVGVTVSRRDFDGEHMATLRSELEGHQISVDLDADLPSGGCRLHPRLGEIDIGLGTQWSALRQLLESYVPSDIAPC